MAFATCCSAQEKIVVQSAPVEKPATKPQNKTGPSDSKKEEAAPDFSKESVVYEQVRGKLRYEKDGTGAMEIRARIRVQSYAGVQKIGQLIFNYQSANEKLELRQIQVTKPDGKVITAGPDAIQDMTSPVAQAAPMYTDMRQKHVTVPGLSAGDILEYETLTTTERALTPGQFWQAWNFVSDDICLDEQVELNVPLKGTLKTFLNADVQPEMRTEGDRHIFTWKTSNLKRAEAKAPSMGFDVERMLQGPRQAAGRRLYITSFSNWGEVSAWYAGLERDRRVPSADVKAKADEVVRGTQNDLEKVQSIYEYVARNIRYVSLSFGVGRYQPHFAGEVLSNQYGDCKDKATLFEAMLEAEGISAGPVLLQTDGDAHTEMPNPLEFDHAISYVKVAGKELWLDSTLGVAPFGYLLPQVRGKRALVVASGEGKELREIPEELAVTALYRVEVDGKIDSDRKMDALLAFETRGDLEVLMRVGLTQVSLSQFSELMAAGARQAGKGTDVAFSNLDASDPFDTRKPLRMKVRMTVAMPDDKKDDIKVKKSTGSASGFDAADLGFFLPFLVASSDNSFKGQLGGPKEMQLHVKFSVPQKLVDNKKPEKGEPVKITKEFAEYEGKWDWDGKTLEGDWRLALKANEIPNEKIADYVNFRTQVLSKLSEFSAKLAGNEGGFRAAAKVSRYSEALSAMRSGKTKEAQKTLEDLVKEDPKYADAWRSLGEVEAMRKNWQKSRDAYQKLTELEPGNYAGYEGIIRGYSAEYRYGEAIAAAKKEVEKASDQANGHSQLGWLYLQMEKYELSAQEYEQSVKGFPKSPWMELQLGRAYAGAHQKEKAQAAFDKAVELDPSALTLNDAAYYAAEGGLDLKNAEGRAKKAVAEIEEKTSAVKLEEVNAGTSRLLGSLAAYWDTLGWIEFKKGNMAEAEKYLRAACDLTDAGTIQMHMGRVYESQGRKEEAIYAYSRTLLPTTDRAFRFDPARGKGVEIPPRPLVPDEREARNHVAALLGGEDKIAELLKESSYNRNWNRTVTTPYTEKTHRRAQMVVMVSPGPKIEGMRTIGDEGEAKALLERFRGKTPPQAFPEAAMRTIPRVAAIHCMDAPAQCELQFFPIEQSDAAFGSAKTEATSGTTQN
jgi:tetratricopeptide (TPR) repeat protein/transglutaminase-like putative cysteine protease